MAKFVFNRNGFKLGNTIPQPSQEQIKNTPALWNADLDTALKYGGELTRQAIGALNLRFDRKYIIVDTKIHMLMPNTYPALPSWHSDGVPRGIMLDPSAKQPPNIFAQEELSDSRFHLLVTGEGCLTQFLKEKNVELIVPDEPSSTLYKTVNQQVRLGVADGALTPYTVPTCTAVEFDWFELHRGVQATKHEWRFLIRVTETDHMTPQTDLSKIIRTQQQVYVPLDFGW
jgi:hypothetical protein